MSPTTTDDEHGYLFAHFREDRHGHAEQIHFSLSRDDSPLRWDPLWGGGPVLEPTIGTTGVRDPAIVRDDAGRFHVIATDLRVWDGSGSDPDWDHFSRHGSRDLILWDSDDLITWEGPRAVTVAPATAGMAWAPEVITDPDTGDRIVFWSSRLFADDDVDHAGSSVNRILYARTRDFVDFSPADVLVDLGDRVVIDTAMIIEGGRVHRFHKDELHGPDSRAVWSDAGSGLFADDFEITGVRLAGDEYAEGGLEAPIVIKDRHRDRWYLFLDQYKHQPQGYFVLQSDDLDSGLWEPVPADEVHIAPATKHGTILGLHRHEWDRLRPFVTD